MGKSQSGLVFMYGLFMTLTALLNTEIFPESLIHCQCSQQIGEVAKWELCIRLCGNTKDPGAFPGHLLSNMLVDRSRLQSTSSSIHKFHSQQLVNLQDQRQDLDYGIFHKVWNCPGQIKPLSPIRSFGLCNYLQWQPFKGHWKPHKVLQPLWQRPSGSELPSSNQW